ncbi:MAG: hypothetical protein HND52_12465 [Ignavibacteriae bacterium]|jgi:hypothetical protein|nr:hypothetical protein [Ignavibacteriota bacterium]NOG98765.1 hypothetical protein [Ignavibacteriota bacterium]
MKNLRIAVLAILFVSILFSSLFAGAYIEHLSARSESDNIIITWQTNQESNLKHFVVLRGTSRDNLSDLAVVQPEGSNSFYEFVDESAYKANDAFYVYQIKIVDVDGTESFSKVISVDHRVSDVKRTWGSIKALFR